VDIKLRAMLRLILPVGVVLCSALLIAGSIPTSITVNSSLNPAVLGQPLTSTAMVSRAFATGNVTFYDGVRIL
jgi:hypothetical protein